MTGGGEAWHTIFMLIVVGLLRMRCAALSAVHAAVSVGAPATKSDVAPPMMTSGASRS